MQHKLVLLFCTLFLSVFLSSCEPLLFGTSQNVILYWSAPLERENGYFLRPYDIGGYEIRYRMKQDNNFTRIVISDPDMDQYTIEHVDAASMIFEIAVFDTDGIYSEFVRATFR